MSAAKRRELVQEGDAEGLKAYLEEHGSELACELERLKKNASLALKKAKGYAPDTVPEWMTWLQRNKEEFRTLLSTATSTRRQLCCRLKPDEKIVPWPRLRPARDDLKPQPWLLKLRDATPGFFALVASDDEEEKHVFFHAYAAQSHWGVALRPSGTRKYALDFAQFRDSEKVFQSMSHIVNDSFSRGGCVLDLEVYAL